MEPDCIDGPVGVASMRYCDLKHGPSAETFEGLDRGIFLAALRSVQGLSYVALYGPRQGLKISPR